MGTPRVTPTHLYHVPSNILTLRVQIIMVAVSIRSVMFIKPAHLLKSLEASKKSFLVLVCLLAMLAMTDRATGATLFGATSAGGPGELFTLNPATGAMLSDVGPLNDLLNVNYPITGLAFNPITGLLYGSTGNSTLSTAAKLVSINPATAQVTVIGAFNTGVVNGSGVPATMADISFDAAGNLFGVASIGGPQLYSINILTGQATVIGTTGLTSTSGGGLAISATSIFYGTPTASRFGTYNSGTGAFTLIANPVKPLGGAYAALDFDGSTLYGLDLGPGPALATHLVTIDSLGGVTDLGASVSLLDAIAFQQPIPEPSAMALLLVVGALTVVNRARKRN
jgi:hypothetical protein